MTAKKKLVKDLVRSLNENWNDWSFNQYIAKNKKTGVEIWIANIPILNLEVCYPTTVSFCLFDKIRIYKALNECRSLWVLSLNSH
jgi:hypothetical protein